MVQAAISIEKYESLQAEYEAYKKEAEQKTANLEFQLEELRRMVFGTKSERFVPDVTPGQLSLFGNEESNESDLEVKTKTIAML